MPNPPGFCAARQCKPAKTALSGWRSSALRYSNFPADTYESQITVRLKIFRRANRGAFPLPYG